MNNKYCSPRNSANSHTCFDDKDLVKIAKYYNKLKDDKINIPKKLNYNTRRTLWAHIQNKLKKMSECDKDICIAKTDLVTSALGIPKLMSTFRPVMPLSWLTNEREWLSTLDIDNVLKQYEDKHNDFKFMGSVPIDFDSPSMFGTGCVSNNLCKINLHNLLKQGKTKLGVVFNSDPHYKSGAHWTSMFVDMQTGGIYYFDSYGIPPQKEIEELMLKLKLQGNKLLNNRIIDINKLKDIHTVVRDYKLLSNNRIQVDNPELFFPTNMIFFGGYKNKCPVLDSKTGNTIINKANNILEVEKSIESEYPIVAMKSFRTFFNDKRFQYKNTECGVYSIYFLDQFLSGKNYDEVINSMLYDDNMFKNREIFFTPNLNKLV